MEVTKEDNPQYRRGCLVCLAVTWGAVKMMICCRCGSLARNRDAERSAEEVSKDSATGTPISSRQARVRFRSVVDVFWILQPRKSTQSTADSIIEDIEETIHMQQTS